MSAGTASVPVGEVIKFAADELRDGEFGRLGRPFYLSAAQRGLVEMNYQTRFYKKVFEAKIPDDFILDLPCDVTGNDMILLYSGDQCTYQNSTVLHIKPNMIHKGGDGYLANNKGFNPDWLQQSYDRTQKPPHTLYFAGQQMGKLYLSQNCATVYDKVHITYTGLGMEDIGDDFQVPYWCREAITDFVIDRAAKAMEREDPQFLGRVINRKQDELKSPRGSWTEAVYRYKRLDKKGRYDWGEYLHRFGHNP